MEFLYLIEEALGEKVVCCRTAPFTQGNSGVLTARISGEKVDGSEFAVVVKSRQGEQAHSALWYAQDDGIADREYHVYDLLERLDLPRARVLARSYVDSTHWTLVLQDLAQDYRMLDTEYQFSEADRASIIRTYAEIHTATLAVVNPIVERLQPEEASQVDERSLPEMLDVLTGLELDSCRLNPDEFHESAKVLLELRERWRAEPRCLTFSDFYQTNVALPKAEPGHAVLFDWELAGWSLPQFDAMNAGFDSGDRLEYYFDCMRRLGVEIDRDRFQAGLRYARLSGSFYTLWLLHLKLKADPTGRLPSWMRSAARDHFAGGLIGLAREASR